MAAGKKYLIEKPEKTQQTAETEDILVIVPPKGSVTVTQTGEAEGDVYAAAMKNATASLEASLNGNLTVTDKSSGGHSTYGIEFANTATIETDKVSKIMVTRNVNSGDDAYVYGIAAVKTGAAPTLTFDSDGGKFLDAVTVSATNTASSGNVEVYGILSEQNVEAGEMPVAGDILFNDELAAAIKVTATSSAAGYAYACGISGSTVNFVSGISKDITANTTQKGSFATACGITADSLTVGTAEESDDIAGIVSATVKNTSGMASAKAIKVSKAFTVNGDMTKNVTANATGTALLEGEDTVTISASAISAGSDIKIHAVSGMISATAMANAALSADKTEGYAAAAKASVLESGNNIGITGNITKSITATATANSVTTKGKDIIGGAAEAYALKSSGELLSVGGTLSGAVKAAATSKASNAAASAITGNDFTVTEGIAAAITATAAATATAPEEGAEETVTTATAKAMEASSMKISGLADAKGNVNAISGLVSATATANASLSADKTEGYEASAEAYALKATGNIQLEGNLAKGITATATANSVTTKYKSAIGGDASAYGISTDGNLILDDSDITGPVKVSATAKAGIATACGIKSDALSVYSNIGTVTAAAAGVSGSEAIGWKVGSITYTKSYAVRMPDCVVGKATVTNKTGTATGMQISGGIFIQYEDLEDKKTGYSKLDISATGKTAVGIDFANADGCQYYFEDSKFNAKIADKKNGIAAYALLDTKGGIQDISLNRSTATGDVSLGAGEDILTLKGKSKITGNVDMGDGLDTVQIHSGSQIKGNVSGVETWTMFLDDAKSKGTALWEGTEFCEDEDKLSAALVLDTTDLDLLDLKKSLVFTLLKDTDGTDAWTSGTVSLKYDDAKDAVTLNIGTKSDNLGGCTYDVESVKKGKATMLQVTIAKA